MNMSQSLVPEFKQEMSITRRCLERIPSDKLKWQPHEKSMTPPACHDHFAQYGLIA